MAQVAVVIRHLPGSRPVTSAVIVESKDHDIDDMAQYFNGVAKEHINDFTNKFVEFSNAEWYVDIVTI